jgi:predicted ATPase
MRADLPTGTVTFVFTDVEGSTMLLHELGAEAYADALAEHRRIVRESCVALGGVEVDTQGDAFFFAFSSAQGAVGAAQVITDGLLPGPIKLRIGLHTGTPLLTDEGYVGDDVHLAARVAAAGHGGQVLLSKASRDLVDGLSITDLGEHRLKDIEGAVPIYQLGSRRFPPLKTISNTNLPRPASSFVGRQRERGELVSMLSDGTRLVTLSGPGGSGKTRLAIEAASELVSAFRAGVFWVGLSALRDPALVTQTIAQTVGAKEDLASYVSERELLLVLDNFEQVVDAAPGVGELLESCPNLKLLVTSRELLRIRGEVDYPVPPLAEPEAVELFCARAQLEPDETIAELCRRLDELPLALELAAARTSVLSPAQILERLSERLDLLKGGRDAGARQQTLRATIEWSHDLLTKEEKRLFARLAVFAGGCTLEAAEQVADADLDTLQSLVDKSLLRHTGNRFWMLETISQFAAERLDDQAEADRLLERHAEWYTRFAKSAERELRGPAAGAWLVRLDPELENLRRAIGWARDRDDRLEVELAESTWYFLSARGLWREALGYLEQALETAQGTSLDESEILWGAAGTAASLGDYAGSQRWSEQRIELGRTRGDSSMIATSLAWLAYTVRASGDPERSRTLYLEAADIASQCGEKVALLNVAHGLADLALEAGDPQTARTHYRRQLELAVELSFPRPEATALVSLAQVALVVGDTDEAEASAQHALRLASALGFKGDIFECLAVLAGVAEQRREIARAARLLAAADALCEETGYNPEPVERAQRDRVASALGDGAALAAAQSEGRAMTLEDIVAYALDEPRDVPVQ